MTIIVRVGQKTGADGSKWIQMCENRSIGMHVFMLGDMKMRWTKSQGHGLCESMTHTYIWTGEILSVMF